MVDVDAAVTFTEAAQDRTAAAGDGVETKHDKQAAFYTTAHEAAGGGGFKAEPAAEGGAEEGDRAPPRRGEAAGRGAAETAGRRGSGAGPSVEVVERAFRGRRRWAWKTALFM